MIFLNDLLEATKGKLTNGTASTQFSDFAFDSRLLKPGQLFLAIRSDTGDGHDYISHAIEQGAAGVLYEEEAALPANSHVTAIVVNDTRQAITDYASYILQKYKPKVIGVTGSNGKTTTKEAIATVLQQRFSVFKNFGSYNGRLGLPVALGQLEAKHEIAVLEMASDSFGEIGSLTQTVQPTVGVITMINRAHLERLGTLDSVAAEKGRLIEGLPFNGSAILNADDPRVAAMVPRTMARILTYGLKRGADVRATDIRVSKNGVTFTIQYEGNSYEGSSQLLGKHQIYSTLAAVTTGINFDIPIDVALRALARMPRVPGRLNPLAGRNGTLLLDDSFSASPEAMLAAIDTLDDLPGATKVAILGNMPELGDSEEGAHREVGEYVATRVHRLITKGELAQFLAEKAQASGLGKRAVHVTFTSDDAAAAVEDLLSPDTVVLVKGGPDMRMERVVKKLLADPKRHSRKLVRQEPGLELVRYRQPARPTWVEINLEAVANNVQLLADMAAPAKIMAVLKADAYGHGINKVTRTALNNGVSWIAVATLGEGLRLREAGIDAPILVLSYMPAWQAHEAVTHNIRATVFTEEIARAFSRAAADVNQIAYVHVKVDSGMGRLGLLSDDVLPFMQKISKLPGLKVEGLYTHFATADEADLSLAYGQLNRFEKVLSELDAVNLRPQLVHAANTASILNMPEARFDLVRPGIGLYGLHPSPDTRLPKGFRSALTFKSTVGQVKTLAPNSPIGYGATYWTKGEETIAIIPVGYADGFRRGPQTWGEVLVKGQRASLVGRVSMDQSAINVSHIPNVRQGDEVILIGRQGSEVITADEVARNLGTVNYEVVSELLARVPRVS